MTDQALTDTQQERNRRLWRGIGTSVIARGAALVTPLVLVPLTLDYVGVATYAIWMSAVSLTAMAVFADLGLGQGLMTVLVPLLVKGDLKRAREVISVTYTLVAAVAVVGCLGILIVGEMLDWATALGAEDPNPNDSAIAAACLLMFVANVPLSLIVRVQYAAQHVGAANLWQTCGVACSLLLAFMSVAFDLGGLLVVMSALSGPLIGNALASVWFYRLRPELRPRPGLVGVRSQLPTLGVLGGGFLALNLVMAVASNLDIILVSHFEAATAVVAFAIVIRLFGQVGSLVALVTVPLWPANAEAITRGDLAWVTRTTHKMTMYSVLAVLAISVPLVAVGDRFFDVWTGEDLDVSRVLLTGAGTWWLLLGALSPRFMVQNSVGVLVPQLASWVGFLIASVPLKVWAVSADHTDWVPLVGVAVGAFTVLPGCIVGYRMALRRGGPVNGGRG